MKNLTMVHMKASSRIGSMPEIESKVNFIIYLIFVLRPTQDYYIYMTAASIVVAGKLVSAQGKPTTIRR